MGAIAAVRQRCAATRSAAAATVRVRWGAALAAHSHAPALAQQDLEDFCEFHSVYLLHYVVERKVLSLALFLSHTLTLSISLSLSVSLNYTRTHTHSIIESRAFLTHGVVLSRACVSN